jgi:glyoxylase-like metal-dependent hydrolase (beta-lactamase superfamily II)
MRSPEATARRRMPRRQGRARRQAVVASSAPTAQPTRAAFDWRRIDLGFVSAYLLIDNTQVVVVDTGTKGSATAIEEALTDLGMGWYAVEHVIFTHHHPDHVGSAIPVLEATEAEAYAGEADVYAIGSPQPLTPLVDGDEVFGLQIIATPGHTPGHICVYDPVGGVLVAGDALVGQADGGGVAGPDAAYTEDMETAHESVRKLAGFSYDTVLFGHGEPVEAGGSRLVQELAGQL